MTISDKKHIVVRDLEEVESVALSIVQLLDKHAFLDYEMVGILRIVENAIMKREEWEDEE